MDRLPYEIIFSIANRLDSPEDLCSFSKVSTLFLSVSRDDRIWKRLCYRLYNIKPPAFAMTQSFHDLFTKILVRYGRYLGYWKSNEEHFGGLIDVHLNLADGTITGEKFDIDDAPHDITQNEEDNEFSLNPVYSRIKLFTIDTTSHQIFCHECDTHHDELPWIKNFDTDKKYFGLSQEALPADDRSALILHEHSVTDTVEGSDIFFARPCSDAFSTVYHPFTIPQPTTGDNDHPLSRFNGLWVGSYGGHGLELLHLELCNNFTCPTTIDGVTKDPEVVPNALVARKVSGDANVPHGKISFAAVHSIEADSDSPICYEGIGQIAHTGYRDAQFIRTKVVPISENVLKVIWFALHHTSLFKRCSF